MVQWLVYPIAWWLITVVAFSSLPVHGHVVPAKYIPSATGLDSGSR